MSRYARTTTNSTPDDLLHAAVKYGNIELIKELVSLNRAWMYVKDSKGHTPVYYACLYGRDEILGYLLSQGARCNLLTADGDSCYKVAASEEVRQIILLHQDPDKQHEVQPIVRPHFMDSRSLFTDFKKLYSDSQADMKGDIEFQYRPDSSSSKSFWVHSFLLFHRFKELVEVLMGTSKEIILQNRESFLVNPIWHFFSNFLKPLGKTNQKKITLPLETNLEDFTAILEYIYYDHFSPKFLKADKKYFFQLLPASMSSALNVGSPLQMSAASLPVSMAVAINNPIGSDVIIFVENRSVFCHRAVLCSRCEIFNAMLSGGLLESQANVLNLEDDQDILHYPFLAIYHMIEYLYTDSIYHFKPTFKFPEVPLKNFIEKSPVRPLRELASNVLFKCAGLFEVDADEYLQSAITHNLVSCQAFYERHVDLVKPLKQHQLLELAFDLVQLSERYLLSGLRDVTETFLTTGYVPDLDSVASCYFFGVQFGLNKFVHYCELYMVKKYHLVKNRMLEDGTWNKMTEGERRKLEMEASNRSRDEIEAEAIELEKYFKQKEKEDRENQRKQASKAKQTPKVEEETSVETGEEIVFVTPKKVQPAQNVSKKKKKKSGKH